jgi:hypothetical protein
LLDLAGRQSVSNLLKRRPRAALLCIMGSLGLAEAIYVEKKKEVPKALAYLIKLFELK